MSQFCTSCGASNSGAAFCTACGASQSESTPEVQKIAEPVDTVSHVIQANLTDSTQVSNQKTSRKKKILISAFVFIIFLGCGIGGFFAGKASIDLKKERSIAYDDGYQQGQVNGISNGKEMGYTEGFSEGKTAGCDSAYDFYDGSWDFITPFDPDSMRITGGYYNRRSSCENG
jgi:hypothetical protein